MKAKSKLGARIAGTAAVLISSAAVATGCGISGVVYKDAQNYTRGGAQISGEIRNIYVDWVSGEVDVHTQKGNTIDFEEIANRDLNDDNSLYYWVDGDTLRIKYASSGYKNLAGLGLSKKLIISVPEDISFEIFSLNGASADYDISNISADDIELRTVSGNIALKDSNAAIKLNLESVSGEIEAEIENKTELLTVNTVSGNGKVTAKGTETVKMESVSGDVELFTYQSPDSLSAGSVSGKVSIHLPEDAGFTLGFKTTSGDLTSELPVSVSDKKYVTGDGRGEFTVKTVSGDLDITGLK